VSQSIDSSDLRPGDRVRVTDTNSWDVTVKGFSRTFGPGTVATADGRSFSPALESLGPDSTATRTWELLDRPTPEPKLGSVWVDPANQCEWAALRDGWYAETRGEGTVGPGDRDYAALIARLVPAEGDA
jgi:hypothetical protein